MNQNDLKLSSQDVATLEEWIRSMSLSQGQVTRAKVILSLSEGMPVTQIAAAQRVSRKTVYKWKARFLESGPDGLLDQPRPGRPSVIDENVVNRVLTLTTERVPHEATHWSVALMAEYAGVTTWQVRQIWQAADLKPHRLKTFKISNDPDFAEKVVDVVGLYMNPPDNAKNTDPSFGSHPTWTAVVAWPHWELHARLQTQRYSRSLCGF